MKIWILLLIAGLLLLWGLNAREGFEATALIKAPPYDTAEQDRMFNMMNNTDKEYLIGQIAEQFPGNSTAQTRMAKEKASGYVARFFNDVYASASLPVTFQQVDRHLQGKSLTPEERTAISRLLKAYFIQQPNASSSTTAATGSTGAAATGSTGAAATGSTGAAAAGSTGAAAAGSTGAAATGSTGTTQGTTAGGTTGGSSVSSAAPNAGPVGSSGKGKSVFGPVFTELGAPVSGGNGTDSSKTNQYPELLGGVGDVTSVRTPSGIQDPSKSWLLSQSGALPSTASLGSDANAAYFPYSRSPGDQDLIPDPYRLSRNYSTASYSSKTDPVPFLTDFSAFFK